MVGVLLDFKDGVGSLSFYNNGVTLNALKTFLATFGNSLRQHTARYLLPSSVHVLRRGAGYSEPQGKNARRRRSVEKVIQQNVYLSSTFPKVHMTQGFWGFGVLGFRSQVKDF